MKKKNYSSNALNLKTLNILQQLHSKNYRCPSTLSKEPMNESCKTNKRNLIAFLRKAAWFYLYKYFRLFIPIYHVAKYKTLSLNNGFLFLSTLEICQTDLRPRLLDWIRRFFGIFFILYRRLSSLTTSGLLNNTF